MLRTGKLNIRQEQGRIGGWIFREYRDKLGDIPELSVSPRGAGSGAGSAVGAAGDLAFPELWGFFGGFAQATAVTKKKGGAPPKHPTDAHPVPAPLRRRCSHGCGVMDGHGHPQGQVPALGTPRSSPGMREVGVEREMRGGGFWGVPPPRLGVASELRDPGKERGWSAWDLLDPTVALWGLQGSG